MGTARSSSKYHLFKPFLSPPNQGSEPSRGPTGTAGIIPRRKDGTGPLAVVLCRENYSGDCRARLGPPGPTG